MGRGADGLIRDDEVPAIAWKCSVLTSVNPLENRLIIDPRTTTKTAGSDVEMTVVRNL